MVCRKPATAITFLASALAALGVGAEEQLTPMVVTASRIEQSMLDAPSNVTVVTKDSLEASGAVRVGDALTAKVPSLYMRGGTGSSARLNSTPIVSMRGQYNRVKMMVDGLSLLDGNNGGPSSVLSINVADIEQIEIAPGVSSALYGSDAVGGVVNFITKVPTKQEISARYVRGFGDGERSAYEASYRNRWESGLGVSISAGYEEMDGFEQNELVVVPVGTTGNGANALQGGRRTTTVNGAPAYIVGDKGASTARQGYLNAKFFYSLDARSRFHAGIARTESKQGYEDFNVYVTRANGSPVTFPLSNASINGEKLGTIRESSFWNSSNPNTRLETRYTAGYDGKLGDAYDLKINLGYFDRQSSNVGAGTGATFNGGPGTMTSAPNTTFDGSAQLGFKIGQNQYLIAGVSTFRTDLDRKVYAVSDWRHPEGNKTGVNSYVEGESVTNALFLQDQLFLGDAVTLYLGGRYDHWSTKGRSFTSAKLGTVVNPERSESAFSPKVAAVYRLTDTVSLRSSLGKAFRAPSNFELYNTTVSGNRQLLADPSVKPETALSWDIGVEKALADQGFLKVAYYDTRMKDMIYRKSQAHTGGLLGITTDAILTNAAEARIKGVELSADIPVMRWLRVSASYTYADPKITKDESDANLQGKTLRYVPKNMASLGLDAQWGKWRAVTSTTYTGFQYATEDNSDTVKNVFGGVSKYWLTNLNVSYRIDKNLTASLKVNNLFDKTYYEYYLMPGRNAAIELSAAF